MATKKRKFADGGDIEYMSPEDVKEAKMRKAAGKAYNKAMPEADTTFGKLKRGVASNRAPGRYDSVRPAGFEGAVHGMKDAAIGEGVRGVGALAKPAALSTIPGGIAGADFQEPADRIRKAVGKYRDAAEMENAAERELSAQDRRESRGFKSGGSVGSASKRADGCAQRGKTKGRMI